MSLREQAVNGNIKKQNMFTIISYYDILNTSNKAYRNLFVIDLFLFHCYSISLMAVLYWGVSSMYVPRWHVCKFTN